MTFTSNIVYFAMGVSLVVGYIYVIRLIEKAESKVRNRARQKEHMPKN